MKNLTLSKLMNTIKVNCNGDNCDWFEMTSLNYGEMLEVLKDFNTNHESTIKAKQFCNLVLHSLGENHNIDDFEIEEGCNPVLELIILAASSVWVMTDAEANYEFGIEISE